MSDDRRPHSHDATTPLAHGMRGASSDRFAPGTVIANRYEILRVAGSGGMGVVYEALDRDLGERIALKTLIGGDDSDRAVAQLRREVLLARRVTHPNVCRIFDVGRHEANGTSTVFVTMEYLDGVTLAEYVRSHTRIQESIAAEILRQICAGLAAAHEAGVVHRDFKSANVLIVRRSSESGIRAVITDFGLARMLLAMAPDEASSSSRHVVGTPAFMAPEQAEGKQAGAAADIYSVGVVAYEMITGELPFDGSLHSLVRRIHEPAPSPRTVVPDVDDQWERVINRCLERDPAQRYLRVADIARDLQYGDVALPRGRRLVRRLAAAALVAVIVATGWVVVRQILPDDPVIEVPAIIAAPRPGVAVIGFRNVSARADHAWLSTAFAEMIATELGASEALRLVPGEEVVRARQDLALGDAEGHSLTTLARLRDRLHARYIVGGSYTATPSGDLRLDIRVQDTDTAETIAALSKTGAVRQLFALVSSAGEELRQSLGNARVGRAVDLRAATPASMSAARLFAEGVARLRQWDARAAVPLLERAVAADPRFALAHAELGDAWAILGHDAKALEHAKKAFQLSASLPRAEKMLVEATWRQRGGDLDAAIALLRRLTQLFPDDPEYRIRLYNALVDNSRGAEARTAIAELARSHPTLEDPRIPLIDASAAETISEHEAMLASADRALAIARKQKNRFVAAEALVIRSTALSMFSKYDEAADAIDAAEAIFVDIGHRAGVAKTYRKRSLIEFRRGNLVEAKRLSERAIVIYEELGHQQGLAAAIGGLGVSLNQLGNHSEARALFEKSLAIYRRVGDRQNSAWAMSSIAGTYVMQHQLDAGISRYEESLALARQVGDVSEVAITLANLGITYADKGDLTAAGKRLTEAKVLFEKIGDRSTAAYVDAQLGSIAYKRGELAAARRYHEEAFALRQTLGERGAVAASQRALAAVALEERNPAGALGFATAAASAFQLAAQPAEEAQALTLVAAAHHELGHEGEARAAIAAAERLVPKIEDPEVVLSIRLARARLRMHDGEERAAAIRDLREIAADAARETMVETAIDARLALGEALVLAGERREADSVLDRVAADATRLHFGRLARRARELRGE